MSGNPDEVADTRPCLSELHEHEGPTVPTAEDVITVTWDAATFRVCGEHSEELLTLLEQWEFDPDGRKP